jgi:hypothetical protein
MNRTLLKTLAAAAIALGTTQAQAEWVSFPGSSHGGKTVNYSVKAGTATASGSGYAGGFVTSLNGGPSFTSYCVDLFEYISFGNTYSNYTLVDGSAHAFTNTRADADIGKLFALHPTITNELNEAAFQIAVWELSYETATTYDVSTGNAKFSGGTAASSGALALANSWLAGLKSIKVGVDIDVLESFTTRTATGRQDVVFAPPVPEPSTYVLMAAGLLSMGFVARRRSRREI